MSWQATNWVIQNSQHKGSALLVMLCIANCANEDGTDCWPNKARLARDTRLSVRQLDRTVNQLEASGELAVRRSTGRYANHYGFPLMQVNPDKMTGLKPTKATPSSLPPNPVISDTNPVIAMSHDPSVEPSVERSGDARPPQIELLREITKRYPPKSIWSVLTNRLGPAPDRPKLEQVYQTWILRGYNPNNYDGITNWYVTGIPPSNGHHLPTQAEMNAGGRGKLVL